MSLDIVHNDEIYVTNSNNGRISSSLFYQAFSIILQRSLIPDLGFCMDYYKIRIPILKKTLLQVDCSDSSLTSSQIQQLRTLISENAIDEASQRLRVLNLNDWVIAPGLTSDEVGMCRRQEFLLYFLNFISLFFSFACCYRAK
jgi:hypothetical protein